MSMKSSTSPRRVYSRKGLIHVCFDGRFYGASEDVTAVSLEHPVTCTKLPSDGGRGRIEVTQKRKGLKTVVETWRSAKV